MPGCPRRISVQCSVSIVKEIFGSIELRVSWKVETGFFLIMTKLSSTKRFQTFGGVAEADIADSSIISMQKFATTGLTGLPIAQPCICL